VSRILQSRHDLCNGSHIHTRWVKFKGGRSLRNPEKSGAAPGPGVGVAGISNTIFGISTIEVEQQQQQQQQQQSDRCYKSNI
jgi:hypothetical protein